MLYTSDVRKIYMYIIMVDVSTNHKCNARTLQQSAPNTDTGRIARSSKYQPPKHRACCHGKVNIKTKFKAKQVLSLPVVGKITDR